MIVDIERPKVGRTQKRYLLFFRSFSRPLSSCCMLLTWCVSRFIFFASRRVNHVSNRRSSSDLVSCNVVKSLKQKKSCGNSINICLLAKKLQSPNNCKYVKIFGNWIISFIAKIFIIIIDMWLIRVLCSQQKLNILQNVNRLKNWNMRRASLRFSFSMFA